MPHFCKVGVKKFGKIYSSYGRATSSRSVRAKSPIAVEILQLTASFPEDL